MKIFLTLLFFSSKLMAIQVCEIQTGAKILFLKSKSSPSSYIKSTSCPYDVTKKWFTILGQAMGNLSEQTINHQLLNFKITMSPKRIYIININKIISRSIRNDHIFLKNIRLTSQIDKLYFDQETRITADCKRCDIPGQKNFKIKIQNTFNSINHNLWGYLDIFVQKMGYVAKSNFEANQSNFHINQFIKKNVLTQSPDKLLTDISKIKYLKSNKPIPKGSIIYNHNFFKVHLVKAYTPIRLILKSGGINLKTMARSLESGSIGQYVKVQKLKTKRILMGKIIDYNVVEVNL